jgi:hypothetical protein
MYPILYLKKGTGGKRARARTLQTTAAKSPKRVEDATEFSEKAIRRILREKECHEPQVAKSITCRGSNRVPKRVAYTRHSKMFHSEQNSCFLCAAKNAPNYIKTAPEIQRK